MLRKFVFVTGAMDILVGLATWIGPFYNAETGVFGEFSNPAKGTLVAFMTLGAFLMFAGAALMWASKDLETRAPIVFWQGLVRMTAVLSILYAIPHGMSYVQEYGVAVFDGIISLVYLVGTVKLLGVSPLKLFLGKTS